MYTQIENTGALTTHMQDDRFDYVVLYFYMAPLQCCVDTLKYIPLLLTNPPHPSILYNHPIAKANQTSTQIVQFRRSRRTPALMGSLSWRLIWVPPIFRRWMPPSELPRSPNSQSVLRTEPERTSDWQSAPPATFPLPFAATAESTLIVHKGLSD